MLLLESEMFCPSKVNISQGFLKLKIYIFYFTILLIVVILCDNKDLSFDNYSCTLNKIIFNDFIFAERFLESYTHLQLHLVMNLHHFTLLFAPFGLLLAPSGALIAIPTYY